MEIKQIIQDLKKIRTETKTKVSDEVLWDSAIRIYNSKNINKSKEKPATKSQIWKLNQLKVKFPKDLTSREASKLIDENK